MRRITRQRAAEVVKGGGVCGRTRPPGCALGAARAGAKRLPNAAPFPPLPLYAQIRLCRHLLTQIVKNISVPNIIE